MKNRITFRSLVAVLVLATLVFAPLAPATFAAPPNFPALGSSIQALTFHISGTHTATETNLVSFVAPFNFRILYMTAVARAKSGTHVSAHGRSTLIVKNAGTAVTAAVGTPAGVGRAVALPAAGTATETNASTALGAPLVAAQQSVASGAALTADLQTWGSSPSLSDITLVIWVQRQS